MTLMDLYHQCAGNHEVIFQISHSGYASWSEYDSVRCDSPLLDGNMELEIEDLTAIDKNVFRFELRSCRRNPAKDIHPPAL